MFIVYSAELPKYGYLLYHIWKRDQTHLAIGGWQGYNNP